jgi:hypothetical protein
MFDVGRIVMPLFGFVLAYTLSRPAVLAHGVFRRVSLRLLIYGAGERAKVGANLVQEP